MNNYYYILLFCILFLLIFKNNSNKKENFVNEDCILKKEILQLITPSNLNEDEESEYRILKDSGIFTDDEIKDLKKYIKKNGISDTFENYYNCNT